MTDAATQFGVPFLPLVHPAAYAKQCSFASFARRTGYSGGWQQYQVDCVDAVRDLVLALVASGSPSICSRAINDNDQTEQLLADLKLPSHVIEVVKFYGAGGRV